MAVSRAYLRMGILPPCAHCAYATFHAFQQGLSTRTMADPLFKCLLKFEGEPTAEYDLALAAGRKLLREGIEPHPGPRSKDLFKIIHAKLAPYTFFESLMEVLSAHDPVLYESLDRRLVWTLNYTATCWYPVQLNLREAMASIIIRHGVPSWLNDVMSLYFRIHMADWECPCRICRSWYRHSSIPTDLTTQGIEPNPGPSAHSKHPGQHWEPVQRLQPLQALQPNPVNMQAFFAQQMQIALAVGAANRRRGMIRLAAIAMMTLALIMALLFMAGVELNPGPPKRDKGKEPARGAKDRDSVRASERRGALEERGKQDAEAEIKRAEAVPPAIATPPQIVHIVVGPAPAIVAPEPAVVVQQPCAPGVVPAGPAAPPLAGPRPPPPPAGGAVPVPPPAEDKEALHPAPPHTAFLSALPFSQIQEASVWTRWVSLPMLLLILSTVLVVNIALNMEWHNLILEKYEWYEWALTEFDGQYMEWYYAKRNLYLLSPYIFVASVLFLYTLFIMLTRRPGMMMTFTYVGHAPDGLFAERLPVDIDLRSDADKVADLRHKVAMVEIEVRREPIHNVYLPWRLRPTVEKFSYWMYPLSYFQSDKQRMYVDLEHFSQICTSSSIGLQVPVSDLPARLARASNSIKTINFCRSVEAWNFVKNCTVILALHYHLLQRQQLDPLLILNLNSPASRWPMDTDTVRSNSLGFRP